MSGRWPAAVRSTAARPKHQPPLSILFCGSDHFSIASLRALLEARREDPRLIQSIHVVHRPAKPTGRGLKTLREVPIAPFAASRSLPTHQLDTFTGWTPPVPISLIVAVSFGLLIPPRVLSLSTYGGLNLHPSLLPDLRGPAPIQQAILRGHDYTGVSVQTLHPHKYDYGKILKQTPPPGTPIAPDATAQDLTEELAESGASMLVDVIKSRRYCAPVPPKGYGWYKGPITRTGRISSRDQMIGFRKHTLDHVLRVQRALGEPWAETSDGERVILHKIVEAHQVGADDSLTAPKGFFVQQGVDYPLFKMQDGKRGASLESTFAGGKKGMGNAKLMQKLTQEGRVAGKRESLLAKRESILAKRESILAKRNKGMGNADVTQKLTATT
ncbi:formyl transferase [Ampelomyces quisqualis]|uniref:methionyl-tRNA formyltransferase n=1 Tax=Ampelomyces quisqualis TaxID=50730 RepID=A0A6A5R1V7_AMPQU|nr:formyl transferase [Ampelomyces quisqualis]